VDLEGDGRLMAWPRKQPPEKEEPLIHRGVGLPGAGLNTVEKSKLHSFQEKNLSSLTAAYGLVTILTGLELGTSYLITTYEC
jgi:hypothetical protein